MDGTLALLPLIGILHALIDNHFRAPFVGPVEAGAATLTTAQRICASPVSPVKNDWLLVGKVFFLDVETPFRLGGEAVDLAR